MRRILSFATMLVTVALLVLDITAEAQEAQPEQAPAFHASLLLIRADWSQSPDAKEIEGDLKQALTDEKFVPAKDAPLAAAASSFLFPVEHASIYSREHYAQLVAWLKKRHVLESAEPFSERAFNAGSFGDGPKKPLLHLEKPTDVFVVEAIAPAKNDLLFSRISKFEWSVYEWGSLTVNRDLKQYEKGRGETEYKPLNRQNYDRCYAKIEPLQDGQVAILSAFPATGDSPFRDELREKKNLLALVVIEQSVTPVAATPTTEARLRLPDKVGRVEANRSFGTSSWSGGLGGVSPPGSTAEPAAPRPKYIDSGDILVSWSADKDVVWGYSKSLGKWAKQVLDPPAKDAPGPVVDSEITGWKVGSTIYAFSGKVARWDVLRLPADHKPTFFISQNGGIVHDGEDVYTFAASTGRWSSPKEGGNAAELSPSGAEAANETSTDASRVKVFALKNARAADAEQIVSRLYGRELDSIAADARTNSLIARGTEDILNIIYHIITRLDESDASPARPTGGSGEWKAAAPSASIENLTDQYQAKENEAQRLAKEIRDLQGAPREHEARIKELREKLNRAVSDAFAARQQLHQAEVAQLQQRIAGMQQTLKTRERLSKEIIEKRVKDLLNPDLQWEATAKPMAGAASKPWGAVGSPDAVKEKTELFARLHDDPQWIENAKDGFRRASTDEERRSALEVQLSWWQDILKALRRLEQLGERIDQELASAQEGVKKTEAEIAALAAGNSPGPASPATGQPKVTVGGWGTDSQFIWDALGLTVEKVDVPELKIFGAMKITAIRSDSAARGLEVGDIVQSMMVSGKAPNIARATLNVLRGKERFPVYVEFPEVKPATTAARKMDASAARAVREKLRERWTQVEKLYEFGRVPLSETLQAAKDANEAEVAAAGSADERREALRGAVERLKHVQASVDAKVAESVEPGFYKLTVDAEVLKAEAELAAHERSPPPEKTSSDSQSASSLPQRAAPGIVLDAGGQTTTLRRPDEFRKELREVESAVANIKSQIQELQQQGKTDSREYISATKNLPSWEQRLAWIRDEYAAQIHLLELEAKDAASAMESAKRAEEVAQILHQQGRTQFNQLNDAQRALETTKLRVERANTLLELYRKADPKRDEGEKSGGPSPAAAPTNQSKPARGW